MPAQTMALIAPLFSTFRSTETGTALPLLRATALRRALLCVLVLGAGTGLSGTAKSESALTLQADQNLEPVRATTFDQTGKAVGLSSFEIETDESGHQRMRVTMAMEGGGSTVSQATLAPTGPKNTTKPTDGPGATASTDASEAVEAQPRLRILEERSQSYTADGVALPLLVVDHQRGRVSCIPNVKGAAEQHLEIEGEDRVINVPMQLFFLPLVRGDVDELNFKVAACGEEPVFYSMIAVRRTVKGSDGRKIVRIEYGPDLGKTIAFFAARLLPKFSFWFDPETNEYMGHQMPLYRKGPDVLLVRHDLTPADLGIK